MQTARFVAATLVASFAGCLAPDAVPGSGSSGTSTTSSSSSGSSTSTSEPVDPLAWAMSYGPDLPVDQRAWSVSAGPGDAVFVAGDYEGSLTVGSLPALQNTEGQDGFVLQLDASGMPTKVVGLSGPGDQRVYRALATNDGVLAAGSFSVSLGIGGQEQGAGPLGVDGFVVKLDSALALSWLVRINGPGDQAVHALAKTSDGGAVLAGTFETALHIGDIVIDGGGMGRQLFLAKVDAAGKGVWAKAIGGDPPNLQAALPTCFLAADPDGSIHVAGTFGGTLRLKDDISAVGDHDVFVGKLDADGNPLWTRTFGATGADQRAAALALTAQGGAVFAGDLRGKVAIGSVALESDGDARDAYLAMLDDSGEPLWAKRYGSPADDRASAVAIDANGDILFAGQFRGIIDFTESATLQNTEAVSSHDDIFLARIDANGKAIYAKSFGKKENQIATSLATDSTGHILLTGYFNGMIDFGTGSLDSKNGLDFFIAKFGQ